MTYYVAAVPANLDPASYPFPEVCPCCLAKLYDPAATWYGWRHGTGLATDDTIKGALWCADCEGNRKEEEANHAEVNPAFTLPGPGARLTWPLLAIAWKCAVCTNVVTESVHGTGNLICCGEMMVLYTGAVGPPTADFWHCNVCGYVVELRTLPRVGDLVCCGENMTHGLP